MLLKRGQNWSIEMLISIGIFITILILTFVYIEKIPSTNDVRELDYKSKYAIASLKDDLKIVNSDNEVDVDVLDKYLDSDLGEVIGIPGTVCINFESLDGDEVIQLDDLSYGIGVDNNFTCSS